MLGEKEGEMEQETITHDLFHEHPLRRIPDATAQSDYFNFCSGCLRYFSGGEAAYGCSLKCGFRHVLHQECMEMAREIRHPFHPSHTLTLTLQLRPWSANCTVCEEVLGGMFYICSRGCEVQIHMGCAESFEIVEADEDERMKHPSHPQHLLKKTRCVSIRCHACGITDAKAVNSSYICTVCSYSIHETCALLPASEFFPAHQHSLALSFYPPYEYVKYEFDCAICSGPLPLRRWVYHCYLCRYVVHINCATKAPSIEKK